MPRSINFSGDDCSKNNHIDNMPRLTTTIRPVLVTERDLDVLDALAAYRFLSIPQLAVLFFPSRGAAEARLRRLHEASLVVRVFMPARPYDRRVHTIYALGGKGAQLLAPRHDGARPRHLTAREQRSALFLDHTLRRNDLRICLSKLSGLSGTNQGPTLINWWQTREDVRFSTRVRMTAVRSQRVTVIPDGSMVLSHGRDLSSYAVEIDMATVRLQSMALKYRTYWTWWKERNAHRRFHCTNFRVLTLTTTESRLAALKRVAQKAPLDSRAGSGLFWFALLAHADIEEPQKILAPVWTVARTRGPKDPLPLLPP